MTSAKTKWTGDGSTVSNPFGVAARAPSVMGRRRLRNRVRTPGTHTLVPQLDQVARSRGPRSVTNGCQQIQVGAAHGS
jgi:hypothetical protein